MHLRITWTYIILLFSSNVELILLKEEFEFFVENVASVFHSNWRQDFLTENPFAKNRFKLTNSFINYNSSDFIYPMILTVGLCLVHRNLKLARDRSNSSLIYVDILNMEYKELPSDWKYENRANAIVACKQVIKNVRSKRLFTKNLIEEMSENIHIEWMKRNGNRSTEKLMVPYANLPEIQKIKDRKAILIASRFFNQFHLYQKFQTTPIHFIE